jgi:hypothetical protein
VKKAAAFNTAPSFPFFTVTTRKQLRNIDDTSGDNNDDEKEQEEDETDKYDQEAMR